MELAEKLLGVLLREADRERANRRRAWFVGRHSRRAPHAGLYFIAVRYAWADNPVCNVYGADGLPLTPFRTDDWPGVTAEAN